MRFDVTFPRVTATVFSIAFLQLALSSAGSAQSSPTVAFIVAGAALAVHDPIAIYQGTAPLHVQISGLPVGTQADIVVSGVAMAHCIADASSTCSADLSSTRLSDVGFSVAAQVAGTDVAPPQAFVNFAGLAADATAVPGSIRLRLPGALGHLDLNSIKIAPSGNPLQATVQSDPDDKIFEIAPTVVQLNRGSVTLNGASITLPAMRGTVSATILAGPSSLSLSGGSGSLRIGDLQASMSALSLAINSAAAEGRDPDLMLSFDIAASVSDPNLNVTMRGTNVVARAAGGTFTVSDADAGSWSLSGSTITLGSTSLTVQQLTPFLANGGVAGVWIDGQLTPTLSNIAGCSAPGTIAVQHLQVSTRGIVGDDNTIGSYFSNITPVGVKAGVAGICATLTKLAIKFRTPHGTEPLVFGLRADATLDVPKFVGSGSIVGRDLEIDENGILSVNAGTWSSNINFAFASTSDTLGIAIAPDHAGLQLSGTVHLPSPFSGVTAAINAEATNTTLAGSANLSGASGALDFSFAGNNEATLINPKVVFANNEVEVSTDLQTTVPFLKTGKLELDDLKFALRDGAVVALSEPTFKKLDSPWTLALDGFEFDLEPPAVDVSTALCSASGLALHKNANNAINGVTICGALLLPTAWTPNDPRGCIFLRDLAFTSDGDVSAKSSSADGGSSCSNEFNVTDYVRMKIQNLTFSWDPQTHDPSLDLHVTAEQLKNFDFMKSRLFSGMSIDFRGDKKGFVGHGDVPFSAATVNFGTVADANLYAAHFVYDSRSFPAYTQLGITVDGSIGFNIKNYNLGWYQDGIGGELDLPKAAGAPVQAKYTRGHPDWWATIGADVPAVIGILVSTKARIGAVHF